MDETPRTPRTRRSTRATVSSETGSPKPKSPSKTSSPSKSPRKTPSPSKASAKAASPSRASTKAASPQKAPAKVASPRKASIKASVKAPAKDDTETNVRLYNAPVLVLTYFVRYVAFALAGVPARVRANGRAVAVAAALVAMAAAAAAMPGPHEAAVRALRGSALWYGWWVALGVASSIGLGTGLHTFVLFLGPFIAEAATAAFKCHSVSFAVRGANAFVCDPRAMPFAVSVWDVARKVRWEAFAWGLGTAVGELPPYFVARAASLAGQTDSALSELEQLRRQPRDEQTLFERGKLFTMELMERFGFFGILLCASIPNPLFDLAGIICGSCGVSFATFFSATALGKAVVKTSIQTLFVIVLFSEETLNALLAIVYTYMPSWYPSVRGFVEAQLSRFDPSEPAPAAGVAGSGFELGQLWAVVVGGMIAYFMVTAVEALGLAQLAKERGASANGGAVRRRR